MVHKIIKLSITLVFIFLTTILTSMSFAQQSSTEDSKTKQQTQSSTLLGMSVTGNKESPRSLTIVPWRDPLMNGKSPEITPVWQPHLKLLDPDAYRRDVNLFLKFRKQRQTIQNAN